MKLSGVMTGPTNVVVLVIERVVRVATIASHLLLLLNVSGSLRSLWGQLLLNCLGRGKLLDSTAWVAALLPSLLLLNLLHNHAFTHTTAWGSRWGTKATRKILYGVLKTDSVWVHHLCRIPLNITNWVNLIVSCAIINQLIIAMCPVERSSALHKEPIRVLMCLTNDNILLRESTVVTMRQVVSLRVL